MAKERWMAIVVSDEKQPYPFNYLLGGAKVAKAGPYDSKKDAENVRDTMKETNEKAGRKVSKAYVRPYNPAPPRKPRKPRLSR